MARRRRILSFGALALCLSCTSIGTETAPAGGGGGEVAAGGEGGAADGGTAGAIALPCGGVDCGAIAAPVCSVSVCGSNDECVTVPADDGAPCLPSSACELGGQCDRGACVGVPNECFFEPVPNECHVSQCNPGTGMCEPVIGNEGGSCSDPAEPCLADKTCAAGVCLGGVPKDCSQLDGGCKVGVCEALTGQCVAQALPNGDPCNDVDGCTSGETCQNGTCAGGSMQTACVGSDLCCPAGCDATSDSDCALDILLIGEGADPAEWNVYRGALTAAGETWDEIDLGALPFPSAMELEQYNTIIFFAEYIVTYVDDLEAQRFADWLALGERHLFVTGEDVFWDFQGPGGTGESNLYQLFETDYAGDYSGPGIAELDGVAGDPISGDFTAPNGLALSMDAASDGDYADPLTGLAVKSASYGPGGVGSGYVALSHHDSGSYQVVWLGIQYHAGLGNAAQRNQLMLNILDYFKL